MDRLQELMDQRAKLWKQMEALNELSRTEARALTAAEKVTWDKMDADIIAFNSQIEQEQKFQQHARLFAANNNPGVGRGTPAPAPGEQHAQQQLAKPAFRTWCLYGPGELTPEERAILNPQKADDAPSRRSRGVGSVIELRAAQGVGSGAIGGFSVADEVMQAIERSMLTFGGMRQASRILPTATGGDLPWPTVNDTAQTGELLAENTAAAQQDVTFAQIVLKAYKYSSKEVLVAQELLEDTSVPIEALIGELLGERIGRITNTHFTTGDNSSKPQGVITGASNGKTAASATAITIDEILDLFHSVDPAYRVGPKVAWMFKDSTFAAIRKLTKADWAGSNPVWQPGLRAGEPDLILGKPYFINQDMAAIATTTKSVLFGDFSKYLIRDVASFRLKRLVERYGEKDQVSFVAFSRHDGRVLDAGTDPLKFITQA